MTAIENSVTQEEHDGVSEAIFNLFLIKAKRESEAMRNLFKGPFTQIKDIIWYHAGKSIKDEWDMANQK